MAARLSNGHKLSLRPSKLSVTLCTSRVRLIHPPRPRVICLYEEEVEVEEEEIIFFFLCRRIIIYFCRKLNVLYTLKEKVSFI